LQELSNGDEPELRHLAPSFNQSFAIEYLQKYSSFIRQREVIRENLELPMREILIPLLINTTAEKAWRTEGLIFADERLNHDLLTRLQLAAEADDVDSHYHFSERVDESFLPLMHAILKEQGIKMIAVRLRRLRDANGEPEPLKLVAYMNELRQWLARNDVPLVDFTHDERITLDLFAVGDHLSKTRGMTAFTPLLAEQIQPIVADCSQQ
ncbi:MAG: hypothetical protein ABI579_08390, partial [Candidatus Sumerlaeota bacterium]